MRKAAWVLALAILFFTGVAGLLAGPNEFQGMRTPLQFTVAIGVTLYGIAGLVAGVGLALKRAWSILATTIWGALVTYVATVASFAFTGPEVPVSARAAAGAGACVASAIIALLVVWVARRETRRLPT